MGEFILMPKLGMTMESGLITKWLVKEGDKVQKGDLLFEVETDKTSLEVESIYEGEILKIYKESGDEASLNQPLAFIGSAGDEIPSEPSSKDEGKSAEKAPGQMPLEVELENKAAESRKVAYDADVVIIGGGPGGYVAAIRAAQLGARVILAEKKKLGGTCLNVGCIPTKALVRNAEFIRSLRESEKMGVTLGAVALNWERVTERKTEVVNRLVGGVKGLLKKNGIEVIQGEGRITGSETVAVKQNDGSEREIKTKNIILATGTYPMDLNIEGSSEIKVLNTDSVFELKKLPESIVIIGGGVVGAEFAGIFNAFGVKVAIVELLPSILSSADEDISNFIRRQFEYEGIEIHTSSKVVRFRKKGSVKEVELDNGKVIEADEILMAVGRKTDDSAFAGYPLKRDQRGYLVVNGKMQTGTENIYAIGDITGKLQLAHAASEQGRTAAENIFGEGAVMDYDIIPSCIFTYPEIACVGMTERQVKEKQIPYKAAAFPFQANGKALTLGHSEGFVKIISDARWGEILGVHIIGPEASSLISEAVIAMKLEGTVEDLAKTIHAHPTLSEAVMEAALNNLGIAVHI
jgi:dihydrolipoamide dehydrogenase